MTERPLLMIPGPIEISPAVVAAYSVRPPSHVGPDVLAHFGPALQAMRAVWCASDQSQPFLVSGSGTLAMEMAAVNVIAPGERALVVDTGYFSARMAEMLRRRGAKVEEIGAPPGDAPPLEAVERALRGGGFKGLFATHVDTSTGVRTDAKGLADIAQRHGALSIFDGVCATAAERFEMEDWGADIYLTASQKAIGLPCGLALLVASPQALEARTTLATPPPMTLDFEEWLPIMKAYEEGRPSYFSTPSTHLIEALRVSLEEILGSHLGAAHGMPARFALHERAGRAMRAAWRTLGLELLPVREELAANTLSAIRYPEGVDATMLSAVLERGVIVAGGLHPALKHATFRVGHMGPVTTQPENLVRTVRAVGEALAQHGHHGDVDAAIQAAEAALVA